MFQGKQESNQSILFTNLFTNRMMCPGSNGSFYGRNTSNNNNTFVSEGIGHLSSQIANLQQTMVTLTDTVKESTQQQQQLRDRVTALEDVVIESQPAKKSSKPDIPRDLSVSLLRLIIINNVQ